MKARSQVVSTVHSPWLPVASAAGAVLLGLIVYNARHGAVSPRIRNPHDTGAPHPLSDPLFGYGHWIVTIEIFSYLALISIIALIVALWRRHPRHPYLLMTIAVSTLAWLDAPMNWATFAAYNPDLWHWPEGWPIVSLSPTIEPLFIAAIAMFVVPTFFPGDLASAAAASAPPESTQPNGRPSVATPPVGRRCAPVVQKGCSRSC